VSGTLQGFVGLVPPQRLLAVLPAEHDEDMARLGGYLRVQHGCPDRRHRERGTAAVTPAALASARPGRRPRRGCHRGVMQAASPGRSADPSPGDQRTVTTGPTATAGRTG
jgi:hypothetical protein